MPADMRKTPSYLKGLAETRARAAGDLERALELLAEAQRAVDAARSDLAACDRLITKFDSSIDPGKIAPIRGYKGRYGWRGDLANAIECYLRENAPSEVGTAEIALAVQTRFNLEFVSTKERRYWVKNSITGRLRKLTVDGVVERLHDTQTAEEGRWRWKQPVNSLAELREQALLAEVPVAIGRRGRLAAAIATEAACRSAASSDAGPSEDRSPLPAAAR